MDTITLTLRGFIMNHDRKSKLHPKPFGSFSPEAMAAIHKYLRVRLGGVTSHRCQFPQNLTKIIFIFDDEGNVVSERTVTDEEFKRWEEEHRSLGLD